MGLKLKRKWERGILAVKGCDTGPCGNRNVNGRKEQSCVFVCEARVRLLVESRGFFSLSPRM